MPLSELIISGFKSFADETKISFSEGITGIVGPNGSGKSNITEAIRWVMGEGSAKSLRGSSMKDVIFAGSDSRKPLNRAMVTLVFDNRDRQLFIDTDQVSIARRIIASGDSEYLINKKNVRLKDIRALFLDAGISQNSLAIISQGRVDQILNSQPEQRRGIFEEAAGVLRFKEQKHEAELEMQKTKENLIRINDLVKELETRIEPLHEQSSLAKEYKFQKEGLDQKLKTLLAFEIHDLSAEKAEKSAKSAESQKLLDRLDHEFKESQEKASQEKAKYEELTAKRDNLQQELYDKGQKLSEINTKLQMAAQSDQFDSATKKEYLSQIATLTEGIANDEAELKAISQKLADDEAEFNSVKKQIADLKATLASDPDSLEEQLTATRNDYMQLLRDQTATSNSLDYLQTELQKLQDKSPLTSDQAELHQAESELANLKAAGEKQKEVFAKVEAAVNDLNQQLAKAKASYQTENSQLQEVSAKLSKIVTRFDVLNNMQKRHDGYYNGVKNILNRLDQYPGVIGVVGELISFDERLSQAMTTALGGSVQNLITDSRKNAQAAIQTLKRAGSGRATFLPLDGLKHNEIPASTRNVLNNVPGFEGIASELVESKADTDISNAIQYLLGTVIIVDNIETATKLHQRVSYYRIITLDGDIITPGGSMTGGARNLKNNSPLQTTAELNKLQKQIEIGKSKENKLSSKCQELAETVKSLESQLAEKTSEKQHLTEELRELAFKYQTQEKEVKRLSDAEKLVAAESEKDQAEFKRIQAEITEKTKLKEKYGEDEQQLKQKIADLETGIQDFAKSNQAKQAELSQLESSFAAMKVRLDNEKSKQLEKQATLDSNSNNLKAIQTKLKLLDENADLSKSKVAELEDLKAKLSAEKLTLDENLGKLNQTMGQMSAKINNLDEISSRNYDLRKNAASEQEHFSVELAKIDSKLSQKLNTLNEEYHLTYENALSQATIENTEETQAELRKAVKLHQMSLAEIGPVNLDSIQEYEEVKSRYDFLHGQQDDLVNAKNNLEASLSELDQEVSDRFKKTFKQVAENFEKIFPRVFGGGNAKLVLTDPENLLTTGVEIIAQPPGKKLQRLSLLSGGERALTAITLLFSMLQVNPVPFCILDEVEAALDETNVTRFAHFMQKYDFQTQFIVITHRRGMMQQADQLFGVVMQESGVSQVLSVSLNDLKEEIS
ncbi:MAG: chromosome segregation protein SMC [Lactobacillus sp.]|nr:chromosome segregation protein SMC [Lactobacillus sp.]